MMTQKVYEPSEEIAERTLNVTSEGYWDMDGHWMQVMAVDAPINSLQWNSHRCGGC